MLNAAIDDLIAREAVLLELEVTERALSHHLANYIGMRVPHPLSVDCEYNRHFDDVKRLNLPPRDALDREIRATTVFPDIIVHQRNSDEQNLLVLELKKPGEDIHYDSLKLSAFRVQFGYQHAAHIVLGLDGSGDLVRELIWIDP